MPYGDITIEVKVEDLLKTLRRNRAKHLREYETAKAGWRKLLKQELFDKIAILDGKKFRARPKNHHLTSIAHQKPQTYVEFYDNAIEMLEYASNDTIELDSNQFREFVKDEWNWKASFTTSNVAYAAASRRR